MAGTREALGLLPLVPIGEGMAVKDDFSLESTVLTLRKLDARDKATKVDTAVRRSYLPTRVNPNPRTYGYQRCPHPVYSS